MAGFEPTAPRSQSECATKLRHTPRRGEVYAVRPCACVAVPAGYAFGNAHRNNLIGPGQNVFDGSARKEFHVTESQRLEFRAEFFNFFNHPNFAQPDNFIDDGPGVAGTITELAIPARQVQFGVKYVF